MASMDTLSSRLTFARERRKLSQPELAKLASVAQGTIGNIEAGIRRGASSLPDRQDEGNALLHSGFSLGKWRSESLDMPAPLSVWCSSRLCR